MASYDDSFLVGEISIECLEAVLSIVKRFAKSSFQAHPDKSQLIPKQELEI